MKIGILGSGMVGKTLGTALAAGGHDVIVGTRDASKLTEWAAKVGARVHVADFAGAAAQGEVVINATAGTGSLDALRAAGERNLADKILIDVANPLDFSRGMPPSLSVCNTDSLAEQIQRAFPRARVVKALNTVNAAVMVAPAEVGEGEHSIFVCGNDPGARAQVASWLEAWFGWKHVVDLGDITAARGTEMVLPLWLRLMGVLSTPRFNFRIVR
jgi:8-hydroxy-5-deazaflavin:NADPH oxidoreductase